MKKYFLLHPCLWINSLQVSITKRLIRIMRITFVLTLITIFNIHATSTRSQNMAVSVARGQMTVEELISEVEKQTEYLFLYSEKEVDLNREVRVNTGSKPVNEVLNQAFANTDISYSFNEDYISLRKKAPEVTIIKQEGNIIRGTITDQTGEPVIGANVVQKGTTNGTVTDIDGNFQINAPANSTLTVSYIGYLMQEVPVKNKGILAIVLKEDSQALEEVVVVGYGTQKKVNLTGSIAAVKTAELENIPVSNLSNTLAGRAPGVTIANNSGFAGASSSIRIRGSFGEPLYVINNVIRDKAAFDALNPNEVETINILKDAASASIYGSKAGNGVVLVTTKKGKMQKPMFQYKGSVSTSGTTRPIQDFSATEELIHKNRVAEYQNSVLATPDPNFKVPYGQEYFDYFKDKEYNLSDMIWRNPWNQDHNISVNGGNEHITYYMMAGYYGEEGSFKNVNYNKFNLRSDITAKITEAFSINLNVSGNERDYKRFFWPYDDAESMTLSDFYRTTFNQSRLYPWYVDADGNPSNKRTEYPVVTGGSHFGELVFGDNYQKTKARDVEAILTANLSLDKYVKGLSASIAGQYNFTDKNRKRFATHNKSYFFQSGSVDNIYIPGPVDPTKMNIHNLGQTYENVQENVWLNHSYQFNWMINYNRSFGQHHINSMVAYEISESKNKYLTGRVDDLLTSSIDQIFVASGDALRRHFNGNESEGARLSWIGRFNYNFDDRYIAEFSFREDGNAKFGPGKRWGFFPSVSLAWRLSNESFFNVDWISNLKIRGSYGTTGDDSDTSATDGVLAAFGWRNKYQSGDGYMFGDNYFSGIKIGSAANPFLTWATLKVYDAGIDYGFFNNSLVGEIDFFHKRKTDILQQRVASAPDTYGRKKTAENYAEQSWTGFELSARYFGNINDVNYTVFANFGYAKDKWEKYDEAINLPGWKSRVGHPNGFIKGYIAEGIIRTQEQLDALPEGFTQFGRKPRLGQILYKDIRSANEVLGADGKVDSNDWDYLSRKADPRINYGFGFNVEWKGISLEALFQGVGAYDRMIRTANGDGVFQVDRPYFELWAGDVWTPENVNAKYPAATGEWNPEYGAAGSTFWMRNGAYLRLKNLNIAYTLPKQWYAQLGVDKVQVFGNGTNLFCISGMDEHDPEQDKLDSYPIMRTFTVGLNINF